MLAELVSDATLRSHIPNPENSFQLHQANVTTCDVLIRQYHLDRYRIYRLRDKRRRRRCGGGT